MTLLPRLLPSCTESLSFIFHSTQQLPLSQILKALHQSHVITEDLVDPPFNPQNCKSLSD